MALRSDDVLARAQAALERHGGRSRMQQRALSRLVTAGKIKAKRIAWLTVAFLFGVPAFSLFVTPIGLIGFVLSIPLFFGLALAAVLLPAGVHMPPEQLPNAPLKALPLSTEAWLSSQRRALPAAPAWAEAFSGGPLKPSRFRARSAPDAAACDCGFRQCPDRGVIICQFVIWNTILCTAETLIASNRQTSHYRSKR
jgi:hypothetical protein